LTLTFQLNTPRDALAKAGRELGALQAAVVSQDMSRIGDCLYNFSVSAYHVKDWLVEDPSGACPKGDVEAFVKATPSLIVCRDLCNASKHRRIRKYVPDASSVTTSAPTSFTLASAPSPAVGGRRNAPFRVKVITADGRRLEVLALGADAIAAWERFFEQHGF